ncbi:uncharacterized protein [Typha angustifolia]|uniref:uncharacterized protein isoform X1 n=1 Tax=Typha angustifolia TaxID=59011 RepID=UPI003C2B3503
MFKSGRWRSDKNKIKAAFKLQFQATQVPQLEWQKMMIVLIPLDTGRPTGRSEKVAVIDGTCHWVNPIYETVKFSFDTKTGKINDKTYQFLLSSTGSIKAGILGEVNINLAYYAEAFRPSSITLPLKQNAGALLHVTIQRMQGDGEEREANEDEDIKERQQQRTFQNQLITGNEEVAKATNTINSIEDCPIITNQIQKFTSSRNLPLHVEANGNLQKSHSFEAIPASGTDTSSGRYNTKKNGIMHNNSHRDATSFLSPLRNSDTPKSLLTSSGDWSGSSAPNGSTDGSTNNSGEAGIREDLQDSDDNIEKLKSDIIDLTRKLDLSELELQTLRKQIIKENRRGQDLSKEINSLKEERDALKKECEELISPQKRDNNDDTSKKALPDGEDAWSLLEEIKKELNHEKNLNANLRLQLQKTQESNTELLLAVKDLDEMLEQKNREISCVKCSSPNCKTEVSEDFHEMKYQNALPYMQNSEDRQEYPEMLSEQDKEEQYALDILVKTHDTMMVRALEKKIIDLKSEVELYRKDREEAEMQMEQLALDYEILKQENHDISSKLEQTQLREQLRMQYECSAHLSIISDLEMHVESLEKELENQSEAFEADLATTVCAKIEQEKRAIKAEEALRKARWNNANTAERLQEEFKTLSKQMSSTFSANERLLMQALEEASELRLQKSQLEGLLEKTQEEIAAAQSQYRVKLKQLLNLVDFKSKETERLLLEIKNKSEEFENQRKSAEAKVKALSEEMTLLKAEMEELAVEKDHLLKENEQKEKEIANMEQLMESKRANKISFQDRRTERQTLEEEIVSLRKQVIKLLDESKDTRHTMKEKETIVRMLNSNIEILNTRYSDMEHSLSQNESQKEKLAMEVLDLRSDLQSREDMISLLKSNLNDSGVIHEELGDEKDLDSKDKEMEGTIGEFNQESSCLSRGVVHKADKFFNKFNYNISSAENGNSFSSQMIGDEAHRLEENDKSRKITIRDPGADLDKASTFYQHDMAKVIREMALLKEQNKSMEAELKEMQERYSEISLKFAEVEGERQQLVIRIRTLKNAMKN